MLDTGDGFFLLKSRSVSRLDEILFMLNTHNVYSLGKPFGLMTTRISEYLQEVVTIYRVKTDEEGRIPDGPRIPFHAYSASSRRGPGQKV